MKIIAGKLVSVRTFRYEVRTGPDKGQIAERMTVTVKVNPENVPFGQLTEETAPSTFQFSLAKGEAGYSDFERLLGGEFVEIGCTRLAKNAAGFTNITIDSVGYTDDETLGYYHMAEIDEPQVVENVGF